VLQHSRLLCHHTVHGFAKVASIGPALFLPIGTDDDLEHTAEAPETNGASSIHRADADIFVSNNTDNVISPSIAHIQVSYPQEDMEQ